MLRNSNGGGARMHEETAIAAAKAGGHAAAGGTIYFGLTMNEIGVVCGIVTSVLMVAISFYFQWRRDRREERESAMRGLKWKSED